MLQSMRFWRIRRKVHSSWLIAFASVGIVAGTAVVPIIGAGMFGSSLWLIAGVSSIIICLWRRVRYLVLFAIIGGALVGLWRGSILQSQLVVYDNLIGKNIQLSGSVVDDPDIGKSDETLLRLANVKNDGHEIAGKIWVSTDRTSLIKRGDIVIVNGVASRGFGSFSASIFDAKIETVQRPEPGDVAGRARDWFGENVRDAINEPQASLGLGYLVGQRRALPPELDQALVVAGLTHIVVASGFNLTILVRFARRLFVKISKYLATLTASAMIVGFIAVTGASPSMSRAGLVAGLSLAAWYYGRKFHPLVLLPFAAAVTVLIDPTYAWSDLGWQLSFAAFAGVMILAPLLQRYFFGPKKPGNIRQVVGETIGATIATLPILILAFGQFSNVAIIANVLILPLVPFAMILTFVAGIGAVVVPMLASAFGFPAEILLTYMTEVAMYFANVPWALTTVEMQPWMAWMSYGILIALCIYLQRVTKYNLRDSNIVE